jgi:divalent metal cation (Fe/Co/Zn/Cd) transporter
MQASTDRAIGGCSCTGNTCSISGSQYKNRIRQLQTITLGWMLLECGIALAAAYQAHSPLLLAFGADSFVELLSATVVLWNTLPAAGGRWPLPELIAARINGVLLFVLAAVVVTISVLSLMTAQVKPETSTLGLIITVAALLVMPILSFYKRYIAEQTGNIALAADAVQSATCAYLALITLFGLAINALFHIPWVDSAAALAVVPILLVEGRRALRGESCGCC